MARRPIEIVAECEMTGFPGAADIERLTARIEQFRRSRPEVVRAAVSSPAVYRDRHYALDTRFLVWAEDGAGAVGVVEDLLKAAGIPCRTVVPSGRAITEAEAPPPANPTRKAAKTAKAALPARRAKPAPASPARQAVRAPRNTARRAQKAGKESRREPVGAPKRAAGRLSGRKRRLR